MKRSISLLSALAFVLMFSGSVFGQAVTTTADVISEVTYSTDSALDFGTFTTSFSGATLDPKNTSGDSNLNGSAGTDYTAGRYNITGSGSQQVKVTLDNSSVDLTHSSSTDILSLTATLSSATDDINTDRGGSSFTSGSNVTLTNGSATIWIGGTLSATDNDGGGLASGTYDNTTDLTLSVEYTF
ncbi:DUF4402 domain-containing protein [Fodinibius sp. SL11]|uniref:DUF4402 domain-containing protein n=1 Tax=Fodinibius sp. SL11 TaxID=3425690 RepID=UPI003F885EEE